MKEEIVRLDKMIIDSINIKNSKMLLNKLKQIKPNHEMYKNINKLMKSSNSMIPALKSRNGSLMGSTKRT